MGKQSSTGKLHPPFIDKETGSDKRPYIKCKGCGTKAYISSNGLCPSCWSWKEQCLS